MLDSLKSYPLYFIQKASPGEGDAFDFAYMAVSKILCK